MAKVKNSLSTFLEQAMIVNNNSLETINKIGDAMSSTEDTIKLVLTDPNDPKRTKEYYIPSFNYLKSEIDRLSRSLETMTNITSGAGSSVKLSDGSYRKIIASKVPSEAPTITSVDNVTTFSYKSNWFFEDMLNPCLFVTCDFTGKISVDTERIIIQRYILKCDTNKKIGIFDTNFKGRNDIDYKEFANILLQNNIKYTLDEDIRDLPPRPKRYYGNFSVINIVSETDPETMASVKSYILDTLEYTDLSSGFENTKFLESGDILDVVKPSSNDPISTRYMVTYADTSENKIRLKIIEGSDGVSIGANTLRISATKDNRVSADINIGYNERQVVFVKAIDPDSNIPSVKWSPGVGFYTNELTYLDSTGTMQSLQRFYQKNVTDFGQVLLSYTNDYYPTIREGIVPDPPVLNYANGEGDFKIVQINQQLTEVVDSESFRSLVSDKAKAQSELSNISKEIEKQKEYIQTTQFASTNDKLAAQSTLSTLIKNQETLTTNYNSIVNNIKSKYESDINYAPKYRVRGFWDIPASKISESSGEQKIIQFKIRYRYLSASGNTNKEEEYSYTSGNSQITGRFSNWNEIETKRRQRVKTTSSWEWESIDTSDPDQVNINQLDIPINPGEQVEIQVKSVSEAGWPSNPLESVWSDPITVAFSDFAELEADDVRALVEQNKVDAAVANVSRMFSSTSAHMSSSFYTNDKYFAHTAESITSGFLSPEQTPITLYDKLQDLQNQLTQVLEQINGATGNINVLLLDNSDEKKIYTLNEGGTTYVNAGDYLSSIKNLENKNGAIVTKTFYIDISTDTQSGLFLLSKLAGNRMSMCPSTIKNDSGKLIAEDNIKSDNANWTVTERALGNDYDNYDNIITPSTTSSTYYMEQGRYDLVPINLTNPETLDFQMESPSMYQSAQCRGQFVYSRFRDIGDTFDMYANGDKDGVPTFSYKSKFENSEINYELDPEYYASDKDRLVTDYNNLTGSDIKTTDISDSDKNNLGIILNRLSKTWKKPESARTRSTVASKILLRTKNLNNLNTDDFSNSVQKLKERVSRLNNATSSNSTIIPKVQSAYGYADLGNINTDKLKDVDTQPSFITTHKIGFEDKDRYAVGKDTCNSYLFLSPVNHTEIQVDGDTLGSTKKVSNGEHLTVPIIYQFRMTDYKNNIFGDPSLDSTSLTVKNTKFANIIGIDIWTEANAIKPKQYDIVVYSTYDAIVDTNTNKMKTSTQSLVNASTEIATKLDQAIKKSINPNIK